MVFLWRLVRRLDPGPAAVAMLGLAVAATVAGQHNPSLRRLLLRCGVSLVLFGFAHVKAHSEGRDDHDWHLVIGIAAVPVGVVSLLVPKIAAGAVIALALLILFLELRDSDAKHRGSRWAIGGQRVRVDFSVGLVIGLALSASSPLAQGETPGPTGTAAAGVMAATLFVLLCSQTRCDADDPELHQNAEARAVSRRLLDGLDPNLAAALKSKMEQGTMLSPAPVAAVTPSEPARPAAVSAGIHAETWDTSRSVAPPGWQ